MKRGVIKIISKISIIAAKTAQRTSRLLKKNGSNIPGVVARKIDKNILKNLANEVDCIVFITGTNGKTTTSQIVGHLFKTNGYQLIHNKEGSNMITGITTSFIDNEKLTKRNVADIAIIEIDEGSIQRITKEITPDVMVVTNFFEDQTDRYGSMDNLIQTIGESIKDKDTKLLLNADDPAAAKLGEIGLETKYFGLDKDAFTFHIANSNEQATCPLCNKELTFDYVHYGKLGHYQCDCGYKRKFPEYNSSRVELGELLRVEVNGQTYDVPIRGSYNSLNVLAAISVSLELGLTPEEIRHSLKSFRMNNGRMELFPNKNSSVLLNLAKNAAGVNASISESNYDPKEKQYLFVLNDLPHDGRDISWINNVDFESINASKTKRILCSGTRAEDLAERVQKAGLNGVKIIVKENVKEAVNELLEDDLNAYIVPSYTALSTVRSLLSEGDNKMIDFEFSLKI